SYPGLPQDSGSHLGHVAEALDNIGLKIARGVAQGGDATLLTSRLHVYVAVSRDGDVARRAEAVDDERGTEPFRQRDAAVVGRADDFGGWGVSAARIVDAARLIASGDEKHR